MNKPRDYGPNTKLTLTGQPWPTVRGARTLEEAVAWARRPHKSRCYVVLAPAGGYYTTSERPRLYQGVAVYCS
jgi:hypothetical protein